MSGPRGKEMDLLGELPREGQHPKVWADVIALLSASRGPVNRWAQPQRHRRCNSHETTQWTVQRLRVERALWSRNSPLPNLVTRN